MSDGQRQPRVWLTLVRTDRLMGRALVIAQLQLGTAGLAIAERQWLQGSLKDCKLRGSCQRSHGSKGLL